MSARSDRGVAARPPVGARILRPAVIVAALYGVVVGALLATHAWDPRFFATLGPQWERHDPGLRKQADGIIYFDFAADPIGAAARRSRLRTARIFYPLVARAVALGRVERVGWSLVLVNLVAIVLGTELVHRSLERRGMSPWIALGYGGWCGLGLALLHDTAEPLAYLCALAGVAAQTRGRPVLAGAAFLGALLTRETTFLFVAPFLLLGPKGRSGAGRWPVPVAVLAAWAVWLGVVAIFGTGSEGPWRAMWQVPLSGFRATRLFDLPATVLFLLVPVLLMLGWAARELWRRPGEAAAWAVALNGLLVLWLPPATAAILWHSARVATGFVAAAVVAAPSTSTRPHLWRLLGGLFALSSIWTAAVTLRYLFWDVAPW